MRTTYAFAVWRYDRCGQEISVEDSDPFPMEALYPSEAPSGWLVVPTGRWVPAEPGFKKEEMVDVCPACQTDEDRASVLLREVELGPLFQSGSFWT